MKPQRLTNILILIVAIGLLRDAQAVVPPPDGGYPNFTTAEGTNALKNLTTGAANTAVGWYSLFSDTTGSFNTAVGAGTLVLNTGDENTAIGTAALLFNTASGNTAVGSRALLNNTTGGTVGNIQGLDVGPNVALGQQALESNTVASANTAVGYQALHSFTAGPVGFEQLGLCTAVGFQALANATGGFDNDAFGYQALMNNTAGVANTAIGSQALLHNTTGNNNTGNGTGALNNNTTGNGNTAIGAGALSLLGGSNSNVALGANAGSQTPMGDGNVYIGADVAPIVPNGESNHTYIRNINTTSVSGGAADTVTVDLSTGLLGHLSSSRRYKEDIQPINDASEILYRLKPVCYRYKQEIDPTQSPAFGLIAEQVAEVSPDLVARGAEGQPESVHYEMVNAMLLNEFLKEHGKVENLEATVAQQQRQIQRLTAGLQQVTAQLETKKDTLNLARNIP